MGLLSVLFGQAKARLVADLREDPYLRYILLLSLLLAGFWFWHRIPNFATWDEHSRVFDALVTWATFLESPGFESFHDGVLWSREPFGGTLLLYGILLLPVALVGAATGSLDALARLAYVPGDYAHWATWHATPRWVWTWSIGIVRLSNVLFAVGTVYVTYRLGTEIWNRRTGRLGALLLTVTFGFLKLAKEGGEDMPAAFFLLLALYLLVRYVQTGYADKFLAASATGGVAVGFKLVAAPIVPMVGLAHLLRTRTDTDRGSWLDAFWQPKLLAMGAGLGFAAILLSFPTTYAFRIDMVLGRIVGDSAGRADNAVGPTAPAWWWFGRTYISAFGLPLLVAAIAGLTASLYTLWDVMPDLDDLRAAAPQFDAQLLVMGCLGLFLLLFSTWHDFRVHHLLPTFPLVAILLGGVLTRWRDHQPTVAAPVIALLLLTSAAYAGVGTAQFASMPRDEATAWLNENAPENATMETYFHGFVEVSVPHRMRLNPLWEPDGDLGPVEACPQYIQVGYKDLLYLRDIPDDQRAYDVDERVDERAAYIRALLDGRYNYTIEKEFGERPPNFVPERASPGSLRDLLPLGIYPHSDQYGDEQELAANQYVAIMEHRGGCNTSRSPPWGPEPDPNASAGSA